MSFGVFFRDFITFAAAGIHEPFSTNAAVVEDIPSTFIRIFTCKI